jgi:hypothetical protein
VVVDPIKENSNPCVCSWLIRSRAPFTVAHHARHIPPLRLMRNSTKTSYLEKSIRINLIHLLAQQWSSAVTLASIFSTFGKPSADLNALAVLNVFAGVQNRDVNFVDLIG